MKWLLAIPHYIVLAFLWLAFTVLSVVALVAILFTGRYPRGIFDFNVGVLRWSWRVAYYSYWTLGTDQYPPFTLAEVPDYPATLSVDYPNHLSHGLVLVKWLLLLPHLLVVGVFAGGGVWLAGGAADSGRVEYPGLIGVLTLVAAVMLAVTGRYPRGVFDLLLGLNRWVLRVAAYGGLMTDTYPPFRLDQGGPDPGSLALYREGQPYGNSGATPGPGAPGEVGAPGTPSPGSSTGRPWTAGRIVTLVTGVLLACAAAALALGGVAAFAVDGFGRDDGFVSTGTQRFSTDSYALTSDEVRIRNEGPYWIFGEDVVGDLRLRAESENGKELFLGVAAASDADRYLRGTAYDVITDTGAPSYRSVDGSAPAIRPGTSDLWFASTAGRGEQTVTLPLREGNWVVVVMNADGTPGVSVTADVSAELPGLPWAGVALVGGAVVLAGLATAPLYFSLRT